MFDNVYIAACCADFLTIIAIVVVVLTWEF